jgi:hypothetical protein
VKWAETGAKAASGDVTLQLAIESPESALGNLQGTLTNELTFDQAVLQSAGLPLP